MSSITIELPETLMTQLSALPRDKRMPFVADALRGDLSENLSDAIAEALYAAELEANFDPVKDTEECRLAVEEGLSDAEVGRDVSPADELVRWEGIKQAMRERASAK